MTVKLNNALTAIKQFIKNHPEYSIHPDDYNRTYRGGTNITVIGKHGDKKIVFKHMCGQERFLNELYCLNFFNKIGIAPKVLCDDGGRLIVMEFLQGGNIENELGNAGKNLDKIEGIGREVGKAVGTLVKSPLPEEDQSWYPPRDVKMLGWNIDLSKPIDLYIDYIEKIRKCIPAYQKGVFSKSYKMILEMRDTVLSQNRILFHEDFANHALYKGIFQGFYDLEMCRLGTPAFQLGQSLAMGTGNLNYRNGFIAGYENRVNESLTETDFLAARAMGQFYCWIRICRYGWWDCLDTKSSHYEAAKTDIEYWANELKNRIERFQGLC